MNSVEIYNMTADRLTDPLTQLDRLIEEVKKYRPDNEIFESHTQQRWTQKKKTSIRQLFTAASKFQRNLRRGVYLASILYHEDRVLVTNEDFIPVIEIDETFPSSIHTDFHWLMKVACAWNETKILRCDMEKNVSSTVHFRTKILTAAIQMQSSLGIQDLGQIYYKSLKDSRGTVVLSTVNYVKSPKSVSLLNSRWIPISKLCKKIVLTEEVSLSEILASSIHQQISYHQDSSLTLTRGLYLAYLKMQSSVDAIKVVVSLKSPNMLPHCKIRDNPHVSQEEWSYLKENFNLEVVDRGSEVQKNFLELVSSACKRLFNYMDISNDETVRHRIYDPGVIYLTEDVSFVVICPSAELSCPIPAKRELLLQRGDLLSFPIQVFELIHFHAYKTNITRKYAKLSCILEIEGITANHMHREAFSHSELVIAKERVSKLQELEHQLNTIWKSVRWLMSVISFARDRHAVGISVRCILQRTAPPFGMPLQRLQVNPDDKTLNKSLGRGSWPGPGNSILPSNHECDLSKSEQNLKSKEYNDFFNIDNHPGEKASEEVLEGCQSDSTLFKFSNKWNPQRVRANTICNIYPLNSMRIKHSTSLVNVQTSDKTELSESSNSLGSDANLPQIKRRKSKIISSKSMTNVKQSLKLNKFRFTQPNCVQPELECKSSNSLTNINTYVDQNCGTSEEVENQVVKTPRGVRTGYRNDSGILQVFAAYETGLASGTSLKLHVTPRTTAREVVDLVIKQLNMAVVLKGKEGPVYNPDKLNNFCLVAVIGARERCLRDDFKPLYLQNPWRKGRLYVRQKQDVLAALEHSSRHSTII